MTVHLVGAGPGDPELLTVKAARLLSTADVVVHDRLVSEATLALVPERCLRIDAGKAAGRSLVSQTGINALLVKHGRRGGTVVRLKGGDPYVFGRGGEEATALKDAGVDFEVVPGISSAIAGPAAAGIPVTLRNRSTSFTVVTGHEHDEGSARQGGSTDGSGGSGGSGESCRVRWEALAASGSTLVILMGAARMARIAARLMAGGLPPSTPVAAVHWATTDRQRVVRTDLGSVGSVPLGAPSIIVVGAVADLDLRGVNSSPAAGPAK